VRVVDGRLRPGMRIAFGAHDSEYEVDEVGYMRLGRFPQAELGPGQVGYLIAAIKRVTDTRVGDTILDADDRASELLPGYREVKPMVFSGLYPTDSDEYE
ncbi:MAG: elongation factor 4, partial [Gammaproteobacteria bacterium]|nr:elongation factor 4 [Gammaproteobacteria bacterium]